MSILEEGYLDGGPVATAGDVEVCCAGDCEHYLLIRTVTWEEAAPILGELRCRAKGNGKKIREECLNRFLLDACKMTGAGLQCDAGRLYHAYLAWHQEHAQVTGTQPYGTKRFQKALRRWAFTLKCESDGALVWEGVRLRPKGEPLT